MTSTDENAANNNNNSTNQAQLAKIGTSDDSFEAILREKSRQRKEREDAQVAHLRIQVNRLEAALQAETKRRIAVTLELQEKARQDIEKLEQKMKKSLKEQQELSNDRFSEIEKRLTRVEERWRKDHLKLEKDISKESKDIRESLVKVQQQAELEAASRKNREEGLSNQLNELSSVCEERWKTERSERESAMLNLQDRLDQQSQRRTQEVSTYADELQSELEALRGELQVEEAERMATDDEIVAALNRYIEQFQKSLAIL